MTMEKSQSYIEFLEEKNRIDALALFMADHYLTLQEATGKIPGSVTMGDERTWYYDRQPVNEFCSACQWVLYDNNSTEIMCSFSIRELAEKIRGETK